MVPISNILLPVDFSERSMDAARQAEALARRFHAAVTVIHVVDTKEPKLGPFEPGGAKGAELETLLAREFTGISIKQVVCEGNPAQKIIDFTADNHVDLIVMASHGYGPFRSFLIGSVAAEVLQNAVCPVWITAHTQQGPPPMFRDVLCAVDLSSDTERVVDWGAQFAAAFTARLFVMHVLRSLESGEEPSFPDDWLSQVDREEIVKVKRKLRGEDRMVFAGGDVREAVCAQAKKLHADLIVVGRSPKADGVGTARTTSFTIIRESPCPVVSI